MSVEVGYIRSRTQLSLRKVLLPGRGKASPGGKPLSIHRGKGERGGKQGLGGPYQRDCKGTSALGRGWPGDLGDSYFLECGAKFYCSITPKFQNSFSMSVGHQLPPPTHPHTPPRWKASDVYFPSLSRTTPIPSPLGSNLERMLEITLLPLLWNDFIFPGNYSRLRLARHPARIPQISVFLPLPGCLLPLPRY